jgi:GTPase SAR1 family protein
MKEWVEELRSNGPKDVVYAIVGNKTDLIDNETISYKVAK